MGATTATESDASDDSSTTAPQCIIGSSGCVCTPGGGCDPGLECQGGVCIPSDTTSETTTLTTASSGSSDETSTSSSSGSDSSSSSTSGIPVGCGDDELEAPEECDDGNNESGDGCNADCTLGGQVLWEYVFAGSASTDEFGYRVATDSEDNVVVAGLGTGAQGDGLLVKLDDDGQLEWDETYDSGFGGDGFLGVAVGPDDQIIVSGRSYTETSYTDIFIRCYSPDGDVLWSHTENGPFYDEGAYDVAIDPNGDVVAVADGRDPSDGSFLTRIVKLTLDGDPVYSEEFAVGNYPRSFALAVDSFSAIYHGGGDGTAMVRKLTPDAEEDWLWQSEAGSWGLDGLAIAPDDSVFSGGGTGSPRHSWVARHFADGSGVDWEVDWEGTYGVYAMTHAIAVDADGRPVTVGRSSDGAQASTLFVRKYDASGEPVWLYEQEAVEITDLLLGVTVDSTGHVIASGFQRQDNGRDDIWVLKLTP